MLYVALMTPVGGTLPERAARRLEWKEPAGLDIVGEYWLQTDSPSVIVIFRADSITPIMAVRAAWGDVFDITVVPAVTKEEGMQLVRQLMPK